MSTSLVINISAHDRPGIMNHLSTTIADGGGNWLESRMARLAGQFVGIICVECDSDKASSIRTSLENLSSEGIHAHILDQGDITDYPFTSHLKIDIFGNDRPGIVSHLARTIADAGANIEELNTSIESAAMSGQPVFHACGTICLPDNCEEASIVSAIEALSDDLTIEVDAL